MLVEVVAVYIIMEIVYNECDTYQPYHGTWMSGDQSICYMALLVTMNQESQGKG